MKALLLIDLQMDYFPGGRFPLKGIKKALVQAQKLLSQFRQAGLPVVHIRHEALKPGAKFFLPGTPGAQIHPGLTPAAREPVLTKNHPNSFRGTGLLEHLQALGVQALHVAGAMTNMCVDTTVRAAYDLGFDVVLHPQACAARGLVGTSLIHKITVATLASTFCTLAKKGG